MLDTILGTILIITYLGIIWHYERQLDKARRQIESLESTITAQLLASYVGSLPGPVLKHSPLLDELLALSVPDTEPTVLALVKDEPPYDVATQGL